ncbi:unnamed protein product [Cuscuta campestris]|uniref:DUF4283 domain-containing protein n=1 Tax=Cuscuta campestris TaxID=132261 RepID=A0A484N056_9ASTE|nr:unnamed protein product [Cuscuta campestris]
MAGDGPSDTHHYLPDVKAIPTHQNITFAAAGNCQNQGAAVAQIAHSSPATTSSAQPPQPSTKVPDVLASSTPPESLHLDVGNVRSPAIPDPPFTIGSLQFPAISREPTVAQPSSSTSGVPTHILDPSIEGIEAGLKKPQISETRVFPNTKSTIRRVEGQIGQKESHIRDPHQKTVRMTLAPPIFAPVDFPATAPATAAVQTAGKIPKRSAQPPLFKKPVPSLSQVLSASKRNSLPTFVTEPLPDREVTVHRGMPAVRFNEAEVSDLALIDKYILVGKFSHGQPKLEVIKNHFATNYVFRGSVSVGWRDSKHVFIMCSNSHDCTNLLLEGTIFFPGDYPMRLFRWTPDFDPEVETSLAPAWILFYDLPLHMFNFHALSLICKPLGKLLGVDKVTLAREKPHVARVCVEVDLLQPLLKEIFVGTSEVVGNEDCGFVQSVVYERVPYYCEYCWKQGHSLDRCKFKVKSGKGSRPPTSEELQLLETSDEPEEPADDLEFDASALPFASTDIDLGRRREKTPRTPAVRTPMICTLNRSANTIPSNRDFEPYPSYCQDPGPSYEDVHEVRYHCDGRRYGEDSDFSDEEEDDVIWAEEKEDIRYKFEPKSKVGYYGNNLQPFQRDLEKAGLSPPRNYRKTRSRYRDYEERFLG